MQGRETFKCFLSEISTMGLGKWLARRKMRKAVDLAHTANALVDELDGHSETLAQSGSDLGTEVRKFIEQS